MSNSPECCKNCDQLAEDGNCRYRRGGLGCSSWLEWFHTEWAGIREAARRLKQKQKEEAENNEKA